MPKMSQFTRNPSASKFFALLILGLFLTFAFSAQAAQPIQFQDINGSNISVPNGFGSSGTGLASQQHLSDFLVYVLEVLLLVVGAIAVAFLMIGGYRYITASGNEEATEAAKKMIIHSILGLIIVVLSFTVVIVITNLLITGQT